MSRPDRRQRPHTGSSRPGTGNTPRRLPTAGGGGDANLDDELQDVLHKEYEEGEHGKMEAMHDVKRVLHQVAQDPMAQKMDQLLPRFLAPQKTAGGDDATLSRAHTSRSKCKPGATPRHGKLTARPRTDEGIRITNERPSVPNLTRESIVSGDMMRLTASAPAIPETRLSTASSVSSSIPPPSSSSSSKKKSRSSKTIDSESTTTTTEATGSKRRAAHSQRQEDDVSRSSTPKGKGKEATQTGTDRTDEEGEMPFTENLLEITSDAEETDEVWKSDIVELTRIKSAPKGRAYIGPASLELKYKDPIWPHQLFLNQILARHPSLTHLVLDGSELRFLRDLGSSLQSLITLSICDCGLRSLDGIYGMPNLRTLIARKNMISIPTQLSFLRKLSYLDLSSNPISSADEFGNLRHCGELRILKLYDTPLAISESNFNKEIKRLVPQLKEIHPSRLYELIGMPKLMVRTRQTISPDRQREARGDHGNPGQNREQVGKQVGARMVAGGRNNETNTKEKSRRNDPSMMLSLAFDAVMVDQPKPGIAYQKIETNKTLKEQEQEHRQKESEINDASLGTGDFFMAPKFLQHLEEAMPPSTAEGDDELESVKVKAPAVQLGQSHCAQDSTGAGGDAANHHQDKILCQQEDSLEMAEDESRKTLRKKSDRSLYQQKQQHRQSSKNHPRGDGDPGCQ